MCESCEVLNINGVNCHEIGCPEAWKGNDDECDWCGSEFVPVFDGQRFCSEDCAESYYN